MTAKAREQGFTRYEIFIIAILTILQFTLILDFMVLSPLGAQLLEELDVSTSQFGLVVSAYAFSAGAAGLMAAGFADSFDRKRMLLFFYTGFIIGTFLCGIAPNYHFLLIARIITGLFGGVIGSISFAIITDLFPMEKRGRVMGYVQMAFASSQVLGLPLGLYLANAWDWHAPFLLIAFLSIFVYLAVLLRMQPINAHLSIAREHSAARHFGRIITNPFYLLGFAATTVLSTGGVMLRPFGSTFALYNLGVTFEQLPVIYMVTGISSMFAGPMLGKLSDKIGKYPIFVGGSLLAMVLVIYYTNLGITPLWFIIGLNVILFAGITSRIIASSALMTAVPAPADRGAFMGINSSVAQISGGIASAAAGMIVVQNETGKLDHYPVLGYVVAVSMLIPMILLYFINKRVQTQPPKPVFVNTDEAG